MRKENFGIFILLTFYLNACGQSIAKSGSTDLEKKVETFIIENENPKYYHSIEFGEKKAFDLFHLIKDYKVPKIFNDEPLASEQNIVAFEWLSTFSNEVSIAYSMSLIFGLKEKRLDPWNPKWVIVLLDDNFNILGYFQYSP